MTGRNVDRLLVWGARPWALVEGGVGAGGRAVWGPAALGWGVGAAGRLVGAQAAL